MVMIEYIYMSFIYDSVCNESILFQMSNFIIDFYYIDVLPDKRINNFCKNL